MSVNGGFARSALRDRSSGWFQGVAAVAGVHGYNPVGLLFAPFGTDGPTGSPALGSGIIASSPQPTVGVTYTVVGTPLLLSAAAAPGDEVVITVLAPADGGGFTPVASASSLFLMRLPLGHALRLDNFTRPLFITCTAE